MRLSSDASTDISNDHGRVPQKTLSDDPHHRSNSQTTKPTEEVLIKDVWADNFVEETFRIMKLLDRYNHVGVDIEFPGILYEQQDDLPLYYTIKMNVEQLKIIQVGFSFADEHGNPPPGTSTWQFNLQFDIRKDKHSKDSIEMLEQASIDFEKHATLGIDGNDFAQWLTVSNMAFNEDVKWICFGGCYDFPYLLKLMSNAPLPDRVSEFYQLLKYYFPCIYDVKSITKDIEPLKIGNLHRICKELDIKRIGMQHQGGSDSLVTLVAFFKVKDQFLRGHIDAYKYMNVIYLLSGESEAQKEMFGQSQLGLFMDPSFYHDPTSSYLTNLSFMGVTPFNMTGMTGMTGVSAGMRYLSNLGIPKMQDLTPSYAPMMYGSFAAYS